MNKNLTEIVLIVDRSGSMADIRSDAEGGINSFIAEQKKLPGQALLTLVQFDTQYEFVHTAKPIAEVGHYDLLPRGGTALLDAVGRAVNETGARLKHSKESHRPGLVVVVIVTDGQENSSHEFSKSKIKEMIEHQQSKYNWQFTFLAANQDAFAEGGALGIKAAGTAGYVPQAVRQVYAATSNNVSRMRSAAASGQAVANEYTAGELLAMQGSSTSKSTKP